MKLVELVLAVCAIGCVPPGLITRSESFHTLAAGSYEVVEKRDVWGRALAEFQQRNVIITFADYPAGILASGGQPAGSIPCKAHYGRCDLTVGWQFTLSDDGTAMLSVRRAVTGDVEVMYGTLLEEHWRDTLDAEADTTLHRIVGPRGSVMAREARQLIESAKLPTGAACTDNKQCRSGTCAQMKCVR